METFEIQAANRRVAAAESREAEAIRLRDQALAELAKVKRDVGWMMGKTLIRDIIMNSNETPAAEPPYKMSPEPEDTERLSWINEHGRVSLGDSIFLVVIPHAGIPGDATIPTPYNIRHLTDLCRASVAKNIIP
jgi:hypothetical protein